MGGGSDSYRGATCRAGRRVETGGVLRGVFREPCLADRLLEFSGGSKWTRSNRKTGYDGDRVGREPHRPEGRFPVAGVVEGWVPDCDAWRAEELEQSDHVHDRDESEV